jgi:hypothetical protein
MRRIALALASAALFGSGCVVSSSSNPPPDAGTVDFSWRFIRTLASGTTATPYSCALGTIDTVQVDFPSGSLSLPCHDPAGDGGAVTGLPPGTQSATLTAFRSGHALYNAQVNVTVVANQVTSAQVDLYGIPDDLDIYAIFRNRFDTGGWSTCANALVASLTYSLVDLAGTVVASGSVSCTDPAGVSFRNASALDRDNYAIRMLGYETGATLEAFDSATTAVAPTCSGQPFNHYGANVGSNAIDVFLYDVSQNTTVCP